MTNHNTARRPLMALLALLTSGALLLAASPAATAGDVRPQGELRVFDDRSDRMHDRIVTCEFWIAGLDMPADNGTLVIKSLPNRTTVLNDTWEANEQGHFVNGPYELEPGRYVVKAFFEHDIRVENGDGPRKVPAAEPREFLVKECPEEPEPVCPTDLKAEALSNGDVRLTFEPAEGSDGSRVYRTVADQDPVLLAELGENATSFVDTTSEPGTTYTYEVRAVFGEEESRDCPTVQVTAIPVFPTVVGALAASTVGLLAYAGIRRRV